MEYRIRNAAGAYLKYEHGCDLYTWETGVSSFSGRPRTGSTFTKSAATRLVNGRLTKDWHEVGLSIEKAE